MRLLRRNHSAAPAKRRRIRKLRLLVLMLALFVLAWASFMFGLVTAVAAEAPKCDPARQHHQVNTKIYDSTGNKILAVLRGSENRVLVDYDDISPLMKQAIVAVEDRRYFEHRGVDMRAIARALWADVRKQGVVQGGSTITQQFIKNSCSDNSRSIGRKVREATLAWGLEQRWSKKKILTSYLNTVYFGNGAYGIDQAARIYFGHRAKKMTLWEVALLAGIPADPSRFDPVTNPRAARQRRRTVLQLMLQTSTISPEQYRRADREPLPKEIHHPDTRGPGGYFANYVTQQLVDKYKTRGVFGGGLVVHTTLDLGLQKLGHRAIARWLKDADGPAAALVAVDPRDGAIKAMIGGSNFRESQFNLAVQGERQAGSAFKPFVLAAALEHGISPETTFVSKPTTIFLGDKGWAVSNYEDEYLGPTDLETATIHSDNSVYAQLTALVGPKAVRRAAHELGVTSRLNDYFAIGLGAEAVNPLEMARAFSTFANRGRRVDGSIFGNRPRAISWVHHVGEKRRANAPVQRPVLDPEKADLMNDILQKVVRQGTGRKAALPDRPAAGKTGTTENYGDAWFVGYTPQLAVAVWVGYPKTLTPMLTEYDGEAVAGGTYPAVIWKSFMESALEYLHEEPAYFDLPSLPYSVPVNVVQRGGRLLVDNGVCREAKSVWYFSGQAPEREAACKPNEVEVPRVIGSTLADAKERLAAQPLEYDVIYKPAKAGQRLDLVLGQIPARGTLSAYDQVTLILAKPRWGVVPSVIGMPVPNAVRRLEKLKLQPAVEGDAAFGRVIRQEPRGGSVAAAPGLPIRLVVARD
ncbi:MAG TPA: PBP1A family penicillin-binding protein [Gaiellaceae bacterium]|nr:PBP1A family penicillin-binding protein [Gaiellaceae bacterium]